MARGQGPRRVYDLDDAVNAAFLETYGNDKGLVERCMDEDGNVDYDMALWELKNVKEGKWAFV